MPRELLTMSTFLSEIKKLLNFRYGIIYKIMEFLYFYAGDEFRMEFF